MINFKKRSSFPLTAWLLNSLSWLNLISILYTNSSKAELNQDHDLKKSIEKHRSQKWPHTPKLISDKWFRRRRCNLSSSSRPFYCTAWKRHNVMLSFFEKSVVKSSLLNFGFDYLELQSKLGSFVVHFLKEV